MRSIVSRQTRINRRLRKYRSDKIQKEQSYNRQEGKLSPTFILITLNTFLSFIALKMFYTKQSINKVTGENEAVVEILNTNKEYSQEEVFEKIKRASKWRKFPESIDAIVKLNVDPTKGDQMIRGTCVLPAGTGKEVKVCVFADGEFHADLKSVGADFIGTD
jgi:hypothetical protein